MADYIYLLQNRLTPAQRSAVGIIHDIARSRNMTVFLVGGAVRDLTSGAPVRDLDVAVQGSALSLRKDLLEAGGVIAGESALMDAVYLNFPGGVRMEVGSTLSVTFPKPGKPAVEHGTILEDLRRRDFTANAMAVSLNEGSYGLLMDPLNGIADIENMELRLVSNYGFIEDPARMIRAARLSARLGWHLEEKTQQRYDTGKAEDYIAALSASQRGYEAEELFHEEDPLRVLRRLESEGWSKVLFPALSAAKVNETELNRLRDLVGQFDAMGIHPDPAPAYFPLLTAKLASADLAALNKSFVRPGFISQVEALDGDAKAFGSQFSGKAAAVPSEAWKMLMSVPPEQVLWLAYSSKSAPVQARFKAFLGEWPQARQRIPYQLMQEMRITPDLPGYPELIENLFFAMMDGKLDTPEAARAYLEPYSPPAPPPPVNLRRRAVKRESKPAKSRSKKNLPEHVLAAVEGEAATIETAVPAIVAPAAEPPPQVSVHPAKPAKKAPTPPSEPQSKSKAPPQKPAAKTVATPATVKAASKAIPVVKKTLAKAAPKKVPAKAKAVPAKKQPTKAVKKQATGKIAAKKSISAAKLPAKAKTPPPQKAVAAKSRPTAKSAVTAKSAKKAPAKAKSKSRK